MENNRVRAAVVLVVIGLFYALSVARADDANRIELSDKQAYPESITASSDGTLYISSLAAGGITRIPRGATKDEPWVKPGAFDTRSTLGVLADNTTHMLWVCSNDYETVPWAFSTLCTFRHPRFCPGWSGHGLTTRP